MCRRRGAWRFTHARQRRAPVHTTARLHPLSPELEAASNEQHVPEPLCSNSPGRRCLPSSTDAISWSAKWPLQIQCSIQKPLVTAHAVGAKLGTYPGKAAIP